MLARILLKFPLKSVILDKLYFKYFVKVLDRVQIKNSKHPTPYCNSIKTKIRV